MSELKAIGLAVVLAAALALAAAAHAAPPSNDAFAAAAELSGRVAEASGITKDATKEAGEPDHAGRSGGASVWYRWTAPADGHVHVSTCGSSFDTVLAAYTGLSVTALTEVASNDDGGDCGLQSRISFTADEGVTYRIAVDGVNGAVGSLTLGLRLAPTNDAFAAAEPLAGDAGSVEGTTVGASHEEAEPDYLYNSVWYRWTAPSSGWATFETCGSSLDTMLLAFTGNELGKLTLLQWGDDECGISSRVSFEASAGVNYRIAVDGYETGEFRLSWNRNPPPPEPPASPEPTSDPFITGVAREGQTLVGSDGEWWGTPPLTFSYAWGRCDLVVGRCDLIPNATSRGYTLTVADIGYRIYLRVTATNVAGSGQAFSDPTLPVRALGPVNTAPPEVIGTAQVGESLIATNGSWRGIEPIQFAYQWQLCEFAGGECTDLQGERQSFIELTAAHLGRRLRVVVTATNVDGARPVASEPSEPVAARNVVQEPRCVVPSIRGRSLQRAKAAIRRAHCATGSVRRAYSRSVRRGRVISQTPRPGTRLKRGARVNLVVSKGRNR